MTVANLRYNHLAKPWDAPLAFGVQAFIEYNGIVLNDRYQEDKIRITKITGLDDADVRDSREPAPGTHGEFPYDAFYGGRNLVLTGNIEAGSLQVLESLKRDLKAAFAPLVEAPLKFKWFDIYDNFDDPKTIFPYGVEPNYNSSGNYEALIGLNHHFKVENGYLSWAKIGKNYLLRVSEQRLFGDVQSTIAITPGSTDNESDFGFIFGVLDKENFARCFYQQNNGEPIISVQAVIDGTANTLEQFKLPEDLWPKSGIPFYLRGKKEGNILTTEFWNREPVEFNLPSASVSENMEGKYADVFGNEILSLVGFGGEQKDISWNFDRYKIESLYPGDVIFNARKLNSLSIGDEQTSQNKYKRSFQITMRASDFRAVGATQLRRTIEPTLFTGEVNPLGRSYPRTYPLKYQTLIGEGFIQQTNLLGINNKGSVFIEPIFVVYGPFAYLRIKNLTNNQEIIWSGVIGLGDYLIIDCSRKKTIRNSTGENKMEFFNSNSSAWIVLEPSQNDLFVSASNVEEGTLLACYWRPAYL